MFILFSEASVLITGIGCETIILTSSQLLVGGGGGVSTHLDATVQIVDVSALTPGGDY